MSATAIARYFRYDPETGDFWWLDRTVGDFSRPKDLASWRTRCLGRQIAFSDQRGYKFTRLFGRKYYAHRLAIALATGEWPQGVVDHINRNPSDNRLKNLRDVSQAVNCKNAGRAPKSASGYRGVYPTKKGTWAVQIWSGGKAISLGRFKELSDAVRVRANAEKAFGFRYDINSEIPAESR